MSLEQSFQAMSDSSGSGATSPSASAKATAPSSVASSPLLLPSTCIDSASPTAPSGQPLGKLDIPTYPPQTAPTIPVGRSLAIDVLRAEARALLAAAERLEQPSTFTLSPGDHFDRAVSVALDALRLRQSSDGRRRRPKGKLVWCGVGKSGLIGRKLHATSLSLGIKSAFLHPIEALHGDLGMVDRKDVVLVLSNSGASSELLALTPHLRARGARMIAVCGRPESELVVQSDAWIDCRLPLLHHFTPMAPPAYGSGAPTTEATPSSSAFTPGLSPSSTPDYESDDDASSTSSSSLSESDCSSFSLRSLEDRGSSKETSVAPEPTAQEPEAWTTVPAPSSSTTLALALGDALLFTLARELGHGKPHFARNHPNGDLGRQLRLEQEQAQNQVAVAKHLANVSLTVPVISPAAPVSPLL